MADKRAGDGKEVTLASLALGNGEGGPCVELHPCRRRAPGRHCEGDDHRGDGDRGGGQGYDGTTSATLDVSGVAFAGMLAGDALEVASAAGALRPRTRAKTRPFLSAGSRWAVRMRATTSWPMIRRSRPRPSRRRRSGS